MIQSVRKGAELSAHKDFLSLASDRLKPRPERRGSLSERARCLDEQGQDVGE
jgi:hypothetical protein